MQLPLYHLDRYYWKPSWVREDFQVFKTIHDELCERDAWIIEGIYFKLLEKRIEHADMIIFLDIPRYRCMWNVIKRAIRYHGKEIPGNPIGCKQELFSLKFVEFLRWIWNFNTKHRKEVFNLLNKASDKKIYIFKSYAEIEKFLNASI